MHEFIKRNKFIIIYKQFIMHKTVKHVSIIITRAKKRIIVQRHY